MPNWCEGTLKVRGKIADLKRFVLEGLQPVDTLGVEQKPLKFFEEDERSFLLEIEKHALWIKGTHRHFCEPGIIGAQAEDSEAPTTMPVSMKAAWRIDASPLQDLCQKYNVDMRVQGFECGMEFSQLIEIVNGEITHDDKIKYDDWNWECPCPLMGG